jgi:hypothetical protein
MQVDPAKLEFVGATRAAVGLVGNRMDIFYAEVTEADRVAPGGGLHDHGEFIEVVELPVGHIESFLADERPKPVGLSMALQWWMRTKSRRSARRHLGWTQGLVAGALAGVILGIALVGKSRV